jgi:LytS/YehU family sensor histidine kinase
VYRNSPEDSESVLLLSDIMRYSFEEPGHDGKVPLQKELEQLNNLIKLNAYRFDHAVDINLRTDGDLTSYTIIPLVLITLTENMFKHGDLRILPRSVNLDIDKSGRMIFTTRNVPKRIRKASDNTHIGLTNTRLRLAYAYPDNFSLHVAETDQLFILELTINLRS